MNEIRLNELLNKIYYEYLDSHEAEEFIIYFKRLKQDKDNLQSKIDKAIDKINQYELIADYYDGNYDEYDDTYSHKIKEELLDILKEDK